MANGFSGFSALAIEDSCGVTVDVIGGAVGSLSNETSELLVNTPTSFNQPAGKAAAVLQVTAFNGLLQLGKEFTSDPVSPGGTVNLKFTVTNKSRSDSATAITFTDDLAATLAGLVVAAEVSNTCAGSTMC